MQLSIVFASDTPSDYLALVLSTKFESFKLSDFQLKRVADASEAWEMLQDPKENVAVAIVWEPYVTRARKQGYTVVLSSRDTPGVIVDAIVASNRLLQSQPDKVSELLSVYYRRIMQISAMLPSCKIKLPLTADYRLAMQQKFV